MASETKKRVCVVGAGISGLCAIKETRDVGCEPVCYERCPNVGGVFNVAIDVSSRVPVSASRECRGDSLPARFAQGGRVYDNCHLTVSSRFMQMSSFPATKVLHWHHSEYLKYMHDYAAHFDLMKHVKLNAEVTSISRVGKLWRVTVKFLDTGNTLTEDYDAVAVCVGTHQVPKQPKLPGIERFAGTIVHTKDYKNNTDFVGKRVVSVGFGESGADIITEVSNVASKMTMSIRSYPYIIPRQPDELHQTSTDSHPVPLCVFAGSPVPVWLMPLKILVVFAGAAIAFCVGVMMTSLRYFGLVCMDGKSVDSFLQPTSPPMMDLKTPATREHFELCHSWAMLGKCHAANKFATKNATCVPNIVSGKLQVNASGIKEISAKEVVFNDGSSAECDVLLLCIGYVDAFPFLEEKYRPPNGVRYLYFHALHPDPDLTSLCFIGFLRPSIGGIPMCSEFVCRYWALLLSGQRQLPDNVADVAKSMADKEQAQFHLSPGISSLVWLQDFVPIIAKEIGCLPKPTTLLRAGLPVLYKIATSNPLPHIFRFDGPGACPSQAAKGILASEGSVSLWSGIKFSLQNILVDLGICKIRHYTLNDFTYDGQSFRDYTFKVAGCSKLEEPLDKFKFVQ